MYKVFIENRPIIFSQNVIKGNNSLVLRSEEIKNLRRTISKIVNANDDRQIVVLAGDALEMEFKRLFRGYQKIEAAGGIVKRKKRYLFIKRNGYWDLPKGKIEKGEDIEQAALREIEEECGIIGPKIKHLVMITYHTYLWKEKNVLKKVYWYEVSYSGSKNVTPQWEEGITKVKWFKKKKVQQFRKKMYLSIVDVLDTYFKDGSAVDV